MKRPAVFCDRDGTIIEDVGYPNDAVAVRLVPGAALALAELKRRGFLLIVVSNQSGIGRGLITSDQAFQVHERFVGLLTERGVNLDGVFYCPHAPNQNCLCRKPLPGLLQQAAEQFSIDLTRSWMLGDKDTDVEAGRRAGCSTLLLSSEADSWSGVLGAIPASNDMAKS